MINNSTVYHVIVRYILLYDSLTNVQHVADLYVNGKTNNL